MSRYTEPESLKILLERIAYLRTEQGLSQRELAAISGVSEDCIRRLESKKNKCGPAFSTLYRIAKALNTTMSVLMLDM